MGNTYNAVTKLHTVTDTGTIMESNTTAMVVQVIYVANTVSHDLEIYDGKGNPAIILKAGASDISPIRFPMEAGGRRFEGLKIQTIESGTAYIYLCKS